MTVRYTLRLTDGDDREIVAARLWGAGALGVQETPTELRAWFDVREDAVPPGGDWEPEPQQDWLATWREGIEPVRAGRVLVVPSWLVEGVEHAPDDVVVELDPGVAFGSGHHATTQLCLEALQRHLRRGDRVLDVGCGTGVLAVAAALLGAGAVEAVDVDVDAVRATEVNAAANRATVRVRHGGVETVDRPARLVLANLLTPTLHTLADALVAVTEPGGLLVASGVATERAAGVTDALVAAGATLVEREDRDGWAVLVLRADAEEEQS